MMTDLPSRQVVLSPGRRTPYAATAANATTAIITLAKAVPALRRTGEAIGSGSRTARAAVTRWSVN
jgi:hypothetical protein